MAREVDSRGWYTNGVMRPEIRTRWGYPRRQAVRYSLNESRDVVAQHQAGFSVAEIAEWHERTENGISMHLYWLGHPK